MAQQYKEIHQERIRASLHHADACPYASNPLPDCHCRHFTARTIPVILRYCGGEYVACPIFKRGGDAIVPTFVLGSEVTP
jgi:hypothetical protein